VAGVSIRTELDRYEIRPGEEFDIRVFLDANDGAGGVQKLLNGLYSYGVKLEFDPTKLMVSGLDAIRVPAGLNFNGFSAGAARQMGSGYAAVKGNIDQSAFVPYADTLLATFHVKDLSGGGQYQVSLRPHRTLGASEQLFLDGFGDVLDGSAAFGSAQILAVPEPSAALMLLAGLGLVGLAARRRLG